jgi:hypothetical protein
MGKGLVIASGLLMTASMARNLAAMASAGHALPPFPKRLLDLVRYVVIAQNLGG